MPKRRVEAMSVKHVVEKKYLDESLQESARLGAAGSSRETTVNTWVGQVLPAPNFTALV